MNATLRTAARRDLYDRITWYDDREPGLGDEFNDAFEAAVRAILANPRMYSSTEETVPGFETRVFFMKKFRHFVTYLIREDEIVILSIDRGNRRASSWLHRLADD
jgi:plasmid stabilization system protein ParE